MKTAVKSILAVMVLAISIIAFQSFKTVRESNSALSGNPKHIITHGNANSKCGEGKAEHKAANASDNNKKAKKCGAGKCGDGKAAKDSVKEKKDAKCGEGKCGEGKAKNTKKEVKKVEGKCGTGKCGNGK
ncbi:MAG TPA: hypothetical protein ENK67_08230 [Flavobacteriia bacterium]|nr:hypothetical protein [Flavobacteriia bacterium]